MFGLPKSSFGNRKFGRISHGLKGVAPSRVKRASDEAVLKDTRLGAMPFSHGLVQKCSSGDFDRHIIMISSSCDFDRPIIMILPKRIEPTTSNASSCHCVRLYFGKPILQIFYQDTNGNNISETYPRRIGQGLKDVTCILGRMLSSLMGLPNPAWVSLGYVVSHMDIITIL